MKKISLLAITALSISFASCKKSYHCECTTVQTSSVTNGVADTPSSDKNVSIREISKTSKKNAQANCGNSTEEGTSSYSFGSTTYNNVTKYSTTCTLK
jgi:hypothetical protein